MYVQLDSKGLGNAASRAGLPAYFQNHDGSGSGSANGEEGTELIGVVLAVDFITKKLQLGFIVPEGTDTGSGEGTTGPIATVTGVVKAALEQEAKDDDESDTTADVNEAKQAPLPVCTYVWMYVCTH